MSSPNREFRQSEWNDHLAGHLAARAVEWFAEDLGHECDWTSVGLIDRSAQSELDVVARNPGVIAGLAAAEVVAGVANSGLTWKPLVADGAAVEAGTRVAVLTGATRSVLAAERVLLNLIGRMSGVATATRRLVAAWQAHPAGSMTRGRRCPAGVCSTNTPSDWEEAGITAWASTTPS